MKQSEKQEMIDEVNVIIGRAVTDFRASVQSAIQDMKTYLKESVEPMVAQNLSISQNDSARIIIDAERYAESLLRSEKADAERMLQIKVQNACILYASGQFPKYECVNIARELELMIRHDQA